MDERATNPIYNFSHIALVILKPLEMCGLFPIWPGVRLGNKKQEKTGELS